MIKTAIISRGLAAALVAGVTTVSVSAEETKDPVNFLFVQHAGSVALDGETLTLQDADANMIIFADRPHRAAAVIPSSNLIKIWGEGQDSMADDPPNAALVGQSEGKPVSMIVELTDPKHADGSLTFAYTVLEGAEVKSIEQSYMVIDSFPFLKVDGLINAGGIATGNEGSYVPFLNDIGATQVRND